METTALHGKHTPQGDRETAANKIKRRKIIYLHPYNIREDKSEIYTTSNKMTSVA